jgi:urease accessory protein
MNDWHRITLQCLSLGGLLAFSHSVSAHTGLLATDGFSHGFLHPFLGLDHCLVMLGLGLWASTQNHRLAGLAVLLFLLFMVAGALFGLAGGRFVYAETGLIVSLLAVGTALGCGTQRVPQPWLWVAVAVFAALHGLAHGSEMPLAVSGVAYMTGMVAATAVLLGLGWILGWVARRGHAIGLLHLYGTLTGLTGVWLLFSA